MKTKNIVKAFGDKFSVKNAWRSLVFCLVIFGLIGVADAQIFTEAVGGSGFDFAYSITQPKEGAPFAVTGPWDYNGVFDAFIAKFDRSGGVLWAKGLGDGSTGGNGVDNSMSVIETSDGGFVITGETCLGTGGDGDLLIAKFNSNGAFEWATAFGGSGWDRGLSVIETHNGEFVVMGVTTSFGAVGWDLLIAKFDSLGNWEWAKRLDGGGNEVGGSIVETYDSSNQEYFLVVTGWTTSFGNGMDILLARFDKDGNCEWAKAIGGMEDDVGESVFGGKYGYLTIDTWGGDLWFDDLIVAGYTTSSSGAGGQDLLVAKFDKGGNLQWAKTLGGASDDRGHSIAYTLPHLLCPAQLVVTGDTESFGAGDKDVLLAAFDPYNGNFQWARTFGDSSNEGGFSVKQALIKIEMDIGFGMMLRAELPAGRLLVAGYTYSWGTGPEDILLATFDPYGFSCPPINTILPTVNVITSSFSQTGSLSSIDITGPTETNIDQDKTYPLTPVLTPIRTPPLVEYTDVGPTDKDVVFSFAIIADNHLHGPELDEVVDWINSNITAEDIRFVMHIGDITDETMTPQGRYSCRSDPLLGIKHQQLDRLQVPYIPLIGNHDVWYNNNSNYPPRDPAQTWFEKRPEEIFNQIFSPEYDYLGNCVLANWSKAPTPIWAKPPNATQPVENYFQNFAFDYMRYHFVCLDWVSRDDVYTSNPSGYDRGWPDLQQWATGGTWDWLEDYLSRFGYIGGEYENMLLFAHHPLSFCDKELSDGGSPIAFKTGDYNQIVSFLSPPYEFNIDKWFAGHVHIPLEEDITDGLTNNQGNLILQTVITAAVSPWAPAPLNEQPYAPALRIIRVHDDLDVHWCVDFMPVPPSMTVGFNGFSSATSPTWAWDFGDGGTATSQNPVYTYTEPGVYKVTLTVTDGSGRKASFANCIDVGTKQLTSWYEDATAYNNARRLIYDNGVLHLIYRWSPADWEAGLTYAKSTDQGRTWFEVTNSGLVGGDYPNGPLMGLYPAMAVDISGKPYITKVRSFGFADEFDAARREKPLGWLKYDRASESGSFGHPSVVVDSDDTLHIAISYDDGIVSEVRYYKGHPGGLIRIDNTFDYEVVESAGSGECKFASIALDSSGIPHVIWQQDGNIYHSKRLASGWAPAAPISTGAARTPSIAADEQGNLHAVWQEDDKVVYKKYNGGWPTTPTTVSPLSSGAEAYPQVVYKDDLLCVVWSDFTGSAHDVYYGSKEGSGSWALPVDLSNTPLKESKFPQAAICSVSPNELCVVWTEGNSYDIRSTYFSFTKTATGTGNACLITDSGDIQNLTAVSEAALPSEGKPNLQFSHGFFLFNITGLTTGQTVTVTIILPAVLPTATKYWKCHTPEKWYQISMGSNDGDNIITIQLTDGGTGDDDGVANGIIVDAGGPGTPLAPDLVITDIWNEDSKIYYEIENIGGADAPRSRSGLYVDGMVRGFDSVKSLAAGESSTESFWYRWTCTPPEDTIKVCADFIERISESNESNNCLTEILTCPIHTRPDLVITDIWDEDSKICYNITNTGSVTASISHSGLHVDGKFMGFDSVKSLAPGESSTESFRYRWTCTPLDDTIKVCADFNERISESNESNNCLTEILTCPIPTRPDLVITDIWNEDSKICYNITNTGSATAPESDSGLYVDGRFRGFDSVKSLAAGESSTESFWHQWTCTPPEDTIKVCADYNERISESNEKNNCLTETWIC